MYNPQKNNTIQPGTGNTVNRKAFFVVLVIWAVTLLGAIFVYVKNKQMSKLSAFVSDYELKDAGTQQSGQQGNEEQALLFVKYPNKKLILTKYTGLSKKTIANITIERKDGPVIISKPKKQLVKPNPDFYIKRAPK